MRECNGSFESEENLDEVEFDSNVTINITADSGHQITKVWLDGAEVSIQDNSLFGVGLDDVDQKKVPQTLIKKDNVICTYHRAYDTSESEINRINMCIDSIEAFLNNKPINKI